MGFLQPARKTGPQIYQRLFLAGDDYGRVLENAAGVLFSINKPEKELAVLINQPTYSIS